MADQFQNWPCKIQFDWPLGQSNLLAYIVHWGRVSVGGKDRKTEVWSGFTLLEHDMEGFVLIIMTCPYVGKLCIYKNGLPFH